MSEWIYILVFIFKIIKSDKRIFCFIGLSLMHTSYLPNENFESTSTRMNLEDLSKAFGFERGSTAAKTTNIELTGIIYRWTQKSRWSKYEIKK